MLPTKIVVIGAGSAIFGLNTLSSLMRSERLRGSHLALVDFNQEAVERMARLAARLNREWEAGMTISTHTQHTEALDGAAFVVSAIEVPPREKLWRRDFEIPLRHGVRQPYAENGGPGGFAHAARNIGPVLAIAHDMEKYCPDAWFINFTNPMVRICDAIHRYSRIKVVGLCHQIYAGYGMAGYVLAKDLGIDVGENPPLSTHADPKYSPAMRAMVHKVVDRLDIKAAGLNHFTWMLSIHDRQTGADLYPLLRARWAQFKPDFEPLTRQVFDAMGLFPIPGDEHLCEYLPWLSDPVTKPWEKFDVSLYDWDRWDTARADRHAEIERMCGGELGINELLHTDSEGAVEVIENIAGAGNHYHLAVNLPNQGYIANLPPGAIVEVPAVISGAGILGLSSGSLPPAIAELLRREITIGQLTVDAAVHGDRHAALQALLLDPTITDLDTARAILDDYLEEYQAYLPQFWGEKVSREKRTESGQSEFSRI
jgi:alpha-galactosidase